MSMTDPIADMLTRIRNANTVRKKSVLVPMSKMKLGIAKILKDEGYIADYEVLTDGHPFIRIALKYGTDGVRIIQQIRRTSKPGCRVYSSFREIPKVLNGLGISILSTPKGVLSDRLAREQRVGGEILCEIY